MKEILSSLDNMGDFPNGLELITNVFKDGEYPVDKTQLDQWAMNFHPHLSEFQKLLCNFEAGNVTIILKKVLEHHCTNDMIALYEMFG